MGLQAALIACLAETPSPESFGRQAAIELHARGCHAEAGAHMAEVFRRSKTPDDRRAAATFAVGAYRDAFSASADKQVGAEYLCRGLVVADEYLATGEVGAARLVTPRAQLARLREPFGACAQVAPADLLLPVRPRRVVAHAPSPTPVTVLTPGPASRGSGRGMVWTGAGLTATGITTAAVGLGVGVSQAAAAAAGADRITAGAPGRGFTDAEKDQLRALRGDLDHAQIVVGTTVAVGVALLVSGVVLTVIGVKRRPPGLAVGPWPRGVVFALRF